MLYWVFNRSSISSPALRSKVNFRTANDIESRLVNEQKFNFAYIYFDVQANYIAMVANSKVPRDSRQRVRLMKEKIRKSTILFIS